MVEPTAMPVTTPDADTVAASVLVLLHTPPVVPLAVRLVVDASQTTPEPLMVPGVASGFTVTAVVLVPVAVQPLSSVATRV